ncbi:MAG: hypothetical protein DMG57_25945 [Acidobacteria bacterium]|nr:MAG: hypothetical protein DMG57_25945 [Acidobacteriota bacterium]
MGMLKFCRSTIEVQIRSGSGVPTTKTTSTLETSLQFRLDQHNKFQPKADGIPQLLGMFFIGSRIDNATARESFTDLRQLLSLPRLLVQRHSVRVV